MSITKENLISELRLEEKTADLILDVLEIDNIEDLEKFVVDHELWSAKSKLDQLYTHDMTYSKHIVIDSLLENFGIESANIEDECLEYSNNGDTYAATIAHDGQEFLITSYGDWVENKEQELEVELLKELEHKFFDSSLCLFMSHADIKEKFTEYRTNAGEYPYIDEFIKELKEDIASTIKHEQSGWKTIESYVNSLPIAHKICFASEDQKDDCWYLVNVVEHVEDDYSKIFFFAQPVSNAISTRIAILADDLNEAVEIMSMTDYFIPAQEVESMSEDECTLTDTGRYVPNFDRDNVQEQAIKQLFA